MRSGPIGPADRDWQQDCNDVWRCLGLENDASADDAIDIICQMRGERAIDKAAIHWLNVQCIRLEGALGPEGSVAVGRTVHGLRSRTPEG